jgi:hypothetical protein
MVVVCDTDVLIPMILPASRSARLFSRLTAAGHIVVTSELILEEVREKMRLDAGVREWLDLPDEDIERFLERLPQVLALTPGSVTVHGVVKDDPDDDMLFATALEGGAQYIISEDRHVRRVKEWQGIKIMNRDAFMKELDRLGVP